MHKEKNGELESPASRHGGCVAEIRIVSPIAGSVGLILHLNDLECRHKTGFQGLIL